ncbi:MAG TPA: DUF6531 domain-containing protein [Polyangia bacterium]|nr:DUF6531 domain-containing protein [Polyangia bacterium]
MIQSTFFDPVLGLDTHIVGIPAPPAPAPVPTPIPMPFVGLVFDPIGLAVGAAIGMATGGGPGIVLVNSLPVTNCGTNVTNMLTMPHIPAPGVTFIPPPKPSNDAMLFFGSLKVTLGISQGVRLGDVALSCNDPVRLPTSLVLAIPKGRLVLNRPPMVPDLAAIATAAVLKVAMKGLGALLKKGAALFRKFRDGSAFFRRLSAKLGGCFAPAGASRWRQMWSRGVRFVTGHPVDVVTGNVFTSVTDVSLPGALPLTIERVYESAGCGKASALGFGWNHSLDESLWMERGRAVVRCGDGREVEFPLWDLPDRVMRPGDELERVIHKMKLRRTSLETFEVEYADGRVHEFAPVAGGDPKVARLTRIRSRDGHHKIDLEYDRQARLEWVRDAAGRLIHFEHDASGRLSTIKLPVPKGRGWYQHRRYAYDSDGNLVRVVDAAGKAWEYGYRRHLLVQETDRNGYSFYFQYDGVGANARCVRTWGDDGVFDHLITYDATNRTTLVEDSLGATTVYAYNERNQVVSITDPHGGTTRLDYDPVTGGQTLEENPAGERIAQRFDDAGNLVEHVAPDGAVTQLEYQGRLPVRAVGPRKGEWRWRYDHAGHLIEQELPTGLRVSLAWEQGLVTSWSEGPERRTLYSYDEQKNLVAVCFPDGSFVRYETDNLGRRVKVRNPVDGTLRLQYDAEGRPVEAQTVAGVIQRLGYDGEGNLIDSQDSTRHVKLSYGHRNRLERREEPAGATLLFEYDTENRPTALVNEGGERHAYTLDDNGRPREEVGFAGDKRVYFRDPAGRVVKALLPSGRWSESKYDPAGRLIERTHSDGTFARFQYDAAGGLISAENESTKVELERDELGRVVAERSNGREVRARLTLTGERLEMTSSLGAHVAIRRDPMRRVSALTFGAADPGGAGADPAPDVQLDRDALGLERARRFANGIQLTWDRDVAGRPLARRTSDRSGQEIDLLEYQWRGEDQIAAITTGRDSASGARSFEHDARGRLIREHRRDGTIERAMDSVGNVYRTPDGRDRRYAPGGRLEYDEGTRYEYDLDGNQTAKVGPDGRRWRYTWNGHGLLSAVEDPDGMRVQLEYDAFARRTKKKVIGAEGERPRETVFVWDGHLMVHELDDRSGLTTWHWEPETFTPVARDRDGARSYIATDHLGTPTEAYDDQGRLVWKMRLDPFGSATIDVGDANDFPWRWPGQYADADLQQSYNFWRWYSPSGGNYLSPDPLGLDGGTRPYGYPPDPLVQLDPFGLVPLNATGYDLYHIIDESTGEVRYVGITNDAIRRQGEHLESGRLGDGYRFEVVETNLTYAQARGYEQADIAMVGRRDTSRIGQEIVAGDPNRCWSYDPARTDSRARAFQRHERARRRARGGC